MELSSDKYTTLKNISHTYHLPEHLDLIVGDKESLLFTSVSDPSHRKGLVDFYTDMGYFTMIAERSNGQGYSIVIAERVEDAESVTDALLDDGEESGHALDYPSCCVDNFSTSTENDRILNKISEVKQYPFYMNRLSRKYKLLSHFPCTYDCEESMQIAERRFDLLEEYDRAVAEEYKDELKKMYIYVSGKGLYESSVSVSDSKFGELPVDINYDSFTPVQPLNDQTIIPTPDKTFSAILNKTDNLTVNGYDHIQTPQINIENPNMRVIFFTKE